MTKEKVLFSWSGGKDSALCLYYALKKYDIVALVTTVNIEFKRISMHGVREELLIAQAIAIGLPLEIVYLENPGTNSQYQEEIANRLSHFKEQGISKIIYGDIFLEDLRKWREKQLAEIGYSAIFPLWKRDTKELINQFLEEGFKTPVCSVSDAFLTEKHVGEIISKEFIDSLPSDVDPCGENGEFHTFVTDGPLFSEPIQIKFGEKVYRPILKSNKTCPLGDNSEVKRKTANGFFYQDLLLKN